MMIMIGIYALFRTKDNKCVYVGESRDIEARIVRHKEKKSHLKTKLTFDFYYKVLEEFDFYDKENQLNKEAYWIKELNPTFNYIRDRRCVPSEETRRKMSESAKKRKPRVLSEETKEKIRKGNAGKKHNMTDEGRKRLSESHKGKSSWNKGIPMKESSKKKLSESHKGLRWKLVDGKRVYYREDE